MDRPLHFNGYFRWMGLGKRISSQMGKNRTVPFWFPIIIKWFMEHRILWIKTTILGSFGDFNLIGGAYINDKMV